MIILNTRWPPSISARLIDINNRSLAKLKKHSSLSPEKKRKRERAPDTLKEKEPTHLCIRGYFCCPISAYCVACCAPLENHALYFSHLGSCLINESFFLLFPSYIYYLFIFNYDPWNCTGTRAAPILQSAFFFLLTQFRTAKKVKSTTEISGIVMYIYAKHPF